MLASSQGISSWTPLKPQHSNPNPNPLANQLWCIDFLTPPTPLIIPHRLPAFLESLMPLITDARFMQRAPKAVWSIPYVSVASFFPSLKQNFIAYRSSEVSSCPDCIFEIHQLWKSGFSRGRPILARPCEGVHRRTSIMNSSLLFQKCPACLVRLIWMVIYIIYIYIYIYPRIH